MPAAPPVLGWLRLLALAGSCLGSSTAPAVTPVDVVALKAAIVYNLLGFIDWPADAAPQAALTLCVDPAGEVTPTLRTLAGRPVRGSRLEVAELAAGADLQRCHAVLAETPRMTALLRHARQLPLLVLGDGTAADDGVMLRLAESGGRLVFDVDLGALRRSRLQIDARLLRLARKVTE